MQSPEIRRALLLTAGLAALWFALAVARDGVTYHLAPMIVAAVPSIALGTGRTPVRRFAGGLAGAGLAGALGVTLVLSLLTRLAGPSLLPFGDATVEAIVFGVVGAGAGWIVGRQMTTLPQRSGSSA